jgi:hypothetical protein
MVRFISLCYMWTKVCLNPTVACIQPFNWESVIHVPDFDLYNNNSIETGLGPGIYSSSNRNEYQNQKNNISGE